MPRGAGLVGHDDDGGGRAGRRLARRATAPLPDQGRAGRRRDRAPRAAAAGGDAPRRRDPCRRAPNRTAGVLELLADQHTGPLFTAALEVWVAARTDRHSAKCWCRSRSRSGREVHRLTDRDAGRGREPARRPRIRSGHPRPHARPRGRQPAHRRLRAPAKAAPAVGADPRRRPWRTSVVDLFRTARRPDRRGRRPGRAGRRPRPRRLGRWPHPPRMDRRPPDRPPGLDRRGRRCSPPPIRTPSARSQKALPRPAPVRRRRRRRGRRETRRLLARWRDGRAALAAALPRCRTAPSCRGSARR